MIMPDEPLPFIPSPEDEHQIIEPVEFDFGLRRRTFMQLVATGLAIAVAPWPTDAQEQKQQRRPDKSGGNNAPKSVWERIHIGKDGVVTVLTGKVEIGQGARGEFTQAAAEELRVPTEQIQVLMSDTGLVPNDGLTAGSGSTPRTVPAIRQAAAAAREALLELASKRWGVERTSVELSGGKITHTVTKRTFTFGELAQGEELPKTLEQATPSTAALTAVSDWKVMGTALPRPNARDIVTGTHRYSSDIKRADMLHGKVLRAPSYGAKLISVDVAPAKAMKDVIVVQDGSFTGVVAPTTARAQEALDAIAKTAKWDESPHPSSKEMYDHLRAHAAEAVPKNEFAEELAAAKKTLRATYHAAYIQHAPMETRAAVAEWKGDQLTVWTGTQNPFGNRSELAKALRIPESKVRVITPDTGGGFGGKHTGEAAIEAARLAQAAGKPVSLKWTRAEEFIWAYFRPAAVSDAEATLDAEGRLTSWHFITLNAGPSALETPYRSGKKLARSINCAPPPLRPGSYRALASTANNFARESFMDELAAAAGADPLEFRLAHLPSGRLRDVLEEAAKRFKWSERVKSKKKDIGLGLACGTEKGSYVAACVEVEIDRKQGKMIPRHVCEVFDCGPIINPDNLRAQVEGGIIMGLGGALREGMEFQNGRMLNASFSAYEVPRFRDLPELDLHMLKRTDVASAGAGETPIIVIAPAIGNAVFHATGVRLRELPLTLPEKMPS
ncbi:MAG: isoquinoline 1-oxidoreductase [Verrucomicrobia bacterium]|nr:MAG: isoquinoline 1-oxidoreductase [Verrucomicrobiota bacterium]